MQRKHQPPPRYITLEGEDYEERRAMEARAREAYCAPKNAKQRKRDIGLLVPNPGQCHVSEVEEDEETVRRFP